MSNQLSNALEFFIATFSELAILFVVISFFVSVINHKLPPQKVKKLLSGNRGYGIAVGLGAATPFCSCSTLPMTIGLIQARASFGPVMAFLFTSPLLNPFIIGLFWISFGAKITIIYSIFVIILAVVSGFILEKLNFQRFIRQDVYREDSRSSTCSDNSEPKQSMSTCCNSLKLKISVQSAGKKLMKETIKQFVSFAPYMAIGVAVGAILHGYVPANSFAKFAEQSLLVLIPASAFIGVFLYVRASTIVPIATSLMAKGMAAGAVISLTVAGAGASLPEMIMMKRMFHWPLLFAFIFVVFATACITGFAIELL